MKQLFWHRQRWPGFSKMCYWMPLLKSFRRFILFLTMFMILPFSFFYAFCPWENIFMLLHHYLMSFSCVWIAAMFVRFAMVSVMKNSIIWSLLVLKSFPILPGKISWIFIPVPTAVDVRTSARPIRLNDHCPRGLFLLKPEIMHSLTFR